MAVLVESGGLSVRAAPRQHEAVVVLERPPIAACQRKRRERREGGELFARQSRPGRVTWGLEKTKFDPPGTSPSL